MTIPGHPRTSETLVRTKQAPHSKPLSPPKVRMTIPGHPRTSETLVRTKQAPHSKPLSPPKVRMTIPGHPRTSRMLVRTSSTRCNRRSNSHLSTRPLLLNHTLGIQ